MSDKELTPEDLHLKMANAWIQNVIWHDDRPPKVSKKMPGHILANIKAIVLNTGDIIEFGEPVDTREIINSQNRAILEQLK